MGNAGDIIFGTKLDDKGLKKGLDDAEKSIGDAGEKSGGRFGKAVKTGLAVAGTAVAAVATGLGALVSKSVTAYGEYEQMVGGVKKLYGNMGLSLEDYASQTGKSVDEVRDKYNQLETAQNLVMENARQAYKTAGMSMNEYMDTATQFSASLVNSLGGDTVKAAELTDVAMRSISDNFNTFGGDIENVKNAYKGFAKANYTMLDNLKLGYGGTKTEMERLIKDANEYASTIGEASDLSIDSFADIVKAIDLIQRKQQIAGTTQREAATTIQGSLHMTKSAWENLLTGMSDSEADISKLMDDFIESAMTLFDNLIPVAEQALESLARVIKNLGPVLAKELPDIISKLLPTLLESAMSLVVELAKALPTIIKVILDTIPKLFQIIGKSIEKELPIIGKAFQGLGNVLEKLFGFIADNGEMIVGILMSVVTAFMAFKAISFITSLVSSIASGVVYLVTCIVNAGGVIPGIMQAIGVSMISGPQAIIVAILALVAVIGFAIYYLATEEEAVKSLDEAQKNHEETIKNLEQANKSLLDSYDTLQESQRKLAELEQQTGESGEALFKLYQEQGISAYENMTDAQKEVLKQYQQLQLDTQNYTEAMKEQGKAAREEAVAGLQEQASAIKENSGSWDEYKIAVLTAFNDGKIGAEEAQQLFSEAMTEMDASTRTAFKENIPQNIKDGIDPTAYETTWQGMKTQWEGWMALLSGDSEVASDNIQTEFTDALGNTQITWGGVGLWFADRFNDITNAFASVGTWFGQKFSDAINAIHWIFGAIGGWFSERWNDISNVFSSVGGWFSDRFSEAVNGIKNVFSGIGDFFSDVWQWIKDALNLDEALNWGSDLIDNFTSGIKNGFDKVKETVTRLAEIIKDFIGFSEPDKGPLSNFHTFAPDMIDLWNKGVEDNLHKVKGTMNEMAQIIADAPTKQLTADLENSLGNIHSNMQVGINSNLSDILATESDRVTLNFYDTQTSPDAIYQKFYQQQTFGLARVY